ncbi:MAG: ABC transporter permease subunit [Clostridiales bacterium]|jgi:putative aldouronate transport system permease protein|nr:ABC transporter permease subunit [Clostridiales bacterium]
MGVSKFMSREAKRNKTLREIPLYIMLIPGIIFVLIYSYGSMVGAVVAFQKFVPTKGLFGSEWIGFDNFKNLFSMPNMGEVIRNTIVISLGKMFGGIIVPVVFALLLNEIKNIGVKRAYQTIVYIPNFLSWVILAGLFVDILSPSTGMVNQFLELFGVGPVFFLGDKTAYPITMIVTEIWKGFGFGSVIYLAALTGIDPALYESAEIDGAGRWKQTVHITLPGIMTTVVLMTVLSMANVLNGGFDQIYNTYSPAVYTTGDILDTFVYRLGIQNAQFALSTAAGLFKSVVSFVFIVVSYYLADKIAGYRIY